MKREDRLVSLVYLVCLICLIELGQPDGQNKPDEPNQHAPPVSRATTVFLQPAKPLLRGAAEAALYHFLDR